MKFLRQRRAAKAELTRLVAWLAAGDRFSQQAVDSFVMERLPNKRLVTLNLVPPPPHGNLKAWKAWVQRLPDQNRELIRRATPSTTHQHQGKPREP